jgi:hypothetical protein
VILLFSVVCLPWIDRKLGCRAPLIGYEVRKCFAERFSKNFQLGRADVAELLFVQVVHRVIELFENVEPGGSDAGFDDAAVFGLAFASDQGALFHAIEQAGHIGIAGDHAVADTLTGKAGGAGATENAQDVVLGAGEAVSLDEEVGVLGEAVGGAEESYEDFGFEAGGNGFAVLVRHGGTIVVITTIVKRKSDGLERQSRLGGAAEPAL